MESSGLAEIGVDFNRGCVMPAEITVQDRYVLMHVEGDPMPPQDIKLALSKAVYQAVKHDLPIMIVREKPVQLIASNVDFFQYGKFLQMSPFKNRLALVFPEEMHHDNLSFFEATVRNRGINVKLFSTINEARNWIGSDT